MMKPLPIGISDYRKVIEKGCYYVDKTLFIEELLSFEAEAILIPRPRRFGKTLNLSMLRYFFEKTEENLQHLFSPFQIGKTHWMERQGSYPVIFLTFKDVKEKTWEQAFKKLQRIISNEFQRHEYLIPTLSHFGCRYSI